jgi:carbon-monoxide dehydrogenase large subunit
VWSPHPAELKLREREGIKTFTAPHYPLPPDKVRFVGEAVAIVVATSVPAARDGAERVAIDYQVLPSVTDTVEAMRPDAPRLFDAGGLERRGRWRAWRP